MMKFLFYILFITLATSCGIQDQLGSLEKSSVEIKVKNSFLVFSISPNILRAGDEAIISGEALHKDLSFKINEIDISYEVVDGNTVKFNAPSGMQGFVRLDISDPATGTTSFVNFMLLGSSSSSLAMGDNSSLCKGVTYAGITGETLVGEKDCKKEVPAPDCKKDGEINCIATPSMPAIMKEGLAEKVIKDKVIGGVTGEFIPDFPDRANVASDDTVNGEAGLLGVCASGEINCIAPSGFVAVDGAALTADKIRKDKVIGGVEGMKPYFPACGEETTGDGSTDCIANNSFKAIKKSSLGDGSSIKQTVTLGGISGTLTLESHSDCSADGMSGCIATTNYPALEKSKVDKTKVRYGISIAGFTGKAIEEIHSPCSSDGSIGCVTSSDYPAVKIADLSSSVIKDGTTIAGIEGLLPSEAHSNCTSDGDIGCVTTASLPAIKKTAEIKELNIRYDIQIAGIAGKLKDSNNYSDCSGDNGENCKATTSFPAIQRSLLDASKFSSEITLAGVSGTLDIESHHPCTSDGEDGCLTTTQYVSADTSQFSESDIMRGYTIAGIGGTVDKCAAGDNGCYVDENFRVVDTGGHNSTDVRDGVNIAGISGSFSSYTLPPCFTDLQVGCLAISSYKAINKGFVQANNIRLGAKILGVDGEYAGGMAGQFVTPSEYNNEVAINTDFNIEFNIKMLSASSGSLEVYTSDIYRSCDSELVGWTHYKTISVSDTTTHYSSTFNASESGVHYFCAKLVDSAHTPLSDIYFSASSPLKVDVPNNWWDYRWKKRRKLIFDTTSISSSLENIPVMVAIDFPTGTPVSKENIRFVDADGYTVLSHEVERWVNPETTGKSYFWVKIPQLNSTSDHIWVYYNNLNASSNEDKENVWDDHYVGVWHLSGVGILTPDSTKNKNHGLLKTDGGSGAGAFADSLTDNPGIEFRDPGDGTVPFIDVGVLDIVSEGSVSDGLTMESWFKLDAIPSAPMHLIAKGFDNNGATGSRFYQLKIDEIDPGTDDTLRFKTQVRVADDTVGPASLVSNTLIENMNIGTWAYGAGVYYDEGGSDTIVTNYNGSITSDTFSSPGSSIESNFHIDGSGAIPLAFGAELKIDGGGVTTMGEPWKGVISEIRISNTARSEDWMRIQRITLEDSGFITYDSEEGIQ